MSKKKILILGAGLAGLSAAWHLQKKGRDCQVFEQEPEAGGLCRSKKVNGFTFDYDGHLLHFRHRYAFNLVNKLLGCNLKPQQRNAWIYAFDTYVRYPFQAKLYGLPPSVIKECLIDFIHTSRNGHRKKKKNPDFLTWINQAFGQGIARHFMIPYNTKFWTLPPQKLTCEWLDGFIPVPSLSEVIEGSVEENKSQFGYNARFWYPRQGGINQLPLAFTRQIKHIHTDCRVREIDLTKKEIKINSGAKEKFDYLVSTIPLPEIPQLIEGLPRQVDTLFKELKWNSIFNLNLGIDKEENSGRHWIYFPQKELCFFRAGFFSNFSSCLAPSGRSSLYTEVAYSKARPIDKDNVVLRIKQDLKKTEILGKNDTVCVQDTNDIKYGYPIYDKNYSRIRKQILKFLSKNNIVPCGRYGSWRYLSMEDVILDGKRVAELIYNHA
ncbi:MAG: FAD-dependent oxidoreductase [Candidatus Omnitrophica bacterium]|nr:FAD-dependent oxidoreductase [Candidatus Omnitrophota bacterium]